jgi:hypothetical protein
MKNSTRSNISAGLNRNKARGVAFRAPEHVIKSYKGSSAVLACTRCHALYFAKHWHTWSNPSVRLPENLAVAGTLCPACESIEGSENGNSNFGYGGELKLSGFADDLRKQEIVKTIKNAASRALKRNPEAQIIKIEDTGKTVRVTTTENQLAVSLGKQVDKSFKGGTLKISFSQNDLPAHITWKDKK